MCTVHARRVSINARLPRVGITHKRRGTVGDAAPRYCPGNAEPVAIVKTSIMVSLFPVIIITEKVMLTAMVVVGGAQIGVQAAQ